MKRRTLIRGLGVMLVAAFVLALGSRTPASVSAQPFTQPSTQSWDTVMCISPTALAPAPPVCTIINGKPTYMDAGTPGVMDVGDAPEVVSNLWIDVQYADNPGYPDATEPHEPFFDLATTYWSGGIIAHPGGTITDGDQVGEITFGIHTNVTAPMTNNIDLTDGQSPVCQLEVNKVHTAFALYDSATAFKPTVSHTDADGNGTADTREDKNGNGLFDGIDKMPAPLVNTITGTGLPASTFISRAFGVAPILLGSETDVNFLVFDVRPLQDPVMSFVSVTVVGYPGVGTSEPTPANAMNQTVVTCAPYESSPVRVFGLSVGNATAVPPIAGGVPLRTVVEEGTFHYDIMISTASDDDGDGLTNAFDRCDIADTAPPGPDGDREIDDLDGDGLTGVCDTNGEGTNPGPYNIVPPWGPGQDLDGDTFLNKADNCPNTPNGSGADVQLNADADARGDACDPDPDVPGDGTGYAGGFHDQDNICRDEFVIPSVDTADGAEPKGEPGSGTSPTKECIAPLTKTTDNPQTYVNPAMHHKLTGNTDYNPAVGYTDSSDDGDPDYLPGVAAQLFHYMSDDSDTDLDGHSDACEVAKGTDALNPASFPPPPAVAGYPGVGGDCDGGGEYDAAESADDKPAGTQDITNPADDTPGLDVDGDGCGDAQEATVMGYDHNNGLDFFDVPVPAKADPTPNGPRNQAVALTDVLAVLFYVGTQDIKTTPNANGVVYNSDKNADTQPDGRDYDRTLSPVPNPPWDAGPPDGAVAIPDVLVNLAQVPLNCIGSRPGAAPMDIAVLGVNLTKNGVVQDPGSVVPFLPGDILDVQVEEHLISAESPPSPNDPDACLQVEESVILVYPPDNPLEAYYHCKNYPDAIVKDPPPLLKKEWKQFCTVEHTILPASQIWPPIDDPDPDFPLMIDAEVAWKLAVCQIYVKTVNLIHFGIGTPPAPVMFNAENAVPGTYPVMVCAREDPHDPKLCVDTDTSNNFLCVPYTIEVPAP